MLPKLLLAFASWCVGWLFAKAVRFAVERALRAINFNVLTERAGTDHFLQQGGLRGDTTTLFGFFAYWVVILATLIIALQRLGLAHFTDLLHRSCCSLPKVLVAMLVVVFGSYFARFVGNAVTTYCEEAQIPDGDLLGKIAQYLIMAFVIMIALSQVEVGGDIVQRTFLVILAASCSRWRSPSASAARTGRPHCSSVGGRGINEGSFMSPGFRPCRGRSFGAQLVPHIGTRFRLWAPSCPRVELEVLQAARWASHPMSASVAGWHELDGPRGRRGLPLPVQGATRGRHFLVGSRSGIAQQSRWCARAERSHQCRTV